MEFDQAAKVYIKIVPWVSFFLVLIVLSIYVFPRVNYEVTTDPSYWGAFGDYFGGILNPIFAILTLIGLALTIRLQFEILNIQKKELVATTDELKKSAEALAFQNKTMLTQSFEDTFFQMLQLQTGLLHAIEFRGQTAKSGVDFFLDEMIRVVTAGSDLKETYENLYHLSNSSLGPYFRNLYHVLKFVDKNQYLNESEKISYTNILRAQLSSAEIVLIFYNGLSVEGMGLKSLLVKYRMLKHIDSSRLASPNFVSDETLYPREAYLARD